MDWNKIAEQHRAVVDEVQTQHAPNIEELAGIVAQRLKSGQRVMACGNGGSAADAQHFAAELVNRYLMDRAPYSAMALSTDSSILTSIGNDYGFEFVFEKQVQAFGRKGDVLIALSTSGNSVNVLNAVKRAKQMEILTVGMTGGSGGGLAELVDHLFCIKSSSSTPRIQEGHELIIHGLCERIEEIMTE